MPYNDQLSLEQSGFQDFWELKFWYGKTFRIGVTNKHYGEDTLGKDRYLYIAAKILCHTSYFKFTISDCSVASILYTLWMLVSHTGEHQIVAFLWTELYNWVTAGISSIKDTTQASRYDMMSWNMTSDHSRHLDITPVFIRGLHHQSSHLINWKNYPI